MNYKEEEQLIIDIQENIQSKKNEKIRKTTFDERYKAQEEKWRKEDKERNDKIVLILKVQDVFDINPKMQYEVLESLDDEDLDELIKYFNKTNNDCDKEIIHKIIDNSI